MAFRVKTTAKAKRDLDTILAWLLSQEAGETGLRWFQGLRDAVASLGAFSRTPRTGFRECGLFFRDTATALWPQAAPPPYFVHHRG
jgi:plasmid stabilization system protein ParE